MQVLGPAANWLNRFLGLGGGGTAAAGIDNTVVGTYGDMGADTLGFAVPSAYGNVFSGGRITAFRNGGIVTRPTLFPMANGAGLMGEAGPEAVMPLTRGPDGKLGVVAQSGGSQIVIAPSISIGMPGGAAGKTNPRDANAIGNEVARQVKDLVVRTLVEQQRSGGVLNPGLSQ